MPCHAHGTELRDIRSRNGPEEWPGSSPTCDVDISTGSCQTDDEPSDDFVKHELKRVGLVLHGSP
jgi:hypothetical protein